MQVTCSSCQKALRIPDSAASRKVRCPMCQTVFRAPPLETVEAKVPEAIPLESASDLDNPRPPRLRDAPDPFTRDDEPPFPVVVTIAGISWIVFGALIVLSVLGLIAFAALASGQARNNELATVTALTIAGFLGLFAIGFIFVGVQSVRGTAPGTVGNGIGSIVYALLNCFGLMMFIGQHRYVEAATAVLVVLGLFVAGILALVGTPNYRAWKRVERLRKDWDDEMARRRRRRDDEADAPRRSRDDEDVGNRAEDDPPRRRPRDGDDDEGHFRAPKRG
jgi:LSD1 subclass zinc finger protein